MLFPAVLDVHRSLGFYRKERLLQIHQCRPIFIQLRAQPEIVARHQSHARASRGFIRTFPSYSTAMPRTPKKGFEIRCAPTWLVLIVYDRCGYTLAVYPLFSGMKGRSHTPSPVYRPPKVPTVTVENRSRYWYLL